MDLHIQGGFDKEEMIFTGLLEYFDEEEDLDEAWIKSNLSEKYAAHQRESVSWKHPTDFERLAKAFDTLNAGGIVALHNAGYTKSDGEGDCTGMIGQLEQAGIKANGFCYYHAQDLSRAVEPSIRKLYIGFDSVSGDDRAAKAIAETIVATLKEHGLDVTWRGTVDQRIEIRNVDWKKIPDGIDWNGERVMEMASAAKTIKKPFWKFW